MPIIDIKYINNNSVVHRVHPSVIIFYQLSVFIVAATFNHPLFLGGLIAFVALIIVLAGIPFRKLKYILIVVAVSFIFVLTQGIWFTSFGEIAEASFETTTLFHLVPSWLPWGPRVAFTLEGAIFGFSLGLRFIAIALAFPLIVMTVHPRDLVTFLSSLRIAGRSIPYGIIFVLTSALRYVPTISQQFDETLDAQRARGVEFDRGGIRRRALAAGSLLVPVITSSLIHARELTLALETRGFGSDTPRTFLRRLHFRPFVDGSLIVLCVLCAALAFWMARLNDIGMLPYTPRILNA